MPGIGIRLPANAPAAAAPAIVHAADSCCASANSSAAFWDFSISPVLIASSTAFCFAAVSKYASDKACIPFDAKNVKPASINNGPAAAATADPNPPIAPLAFPIPFVNAGNLPAAGPVGAAAAPAAAPLEIILPS